MQCITSSYGRSYLSRNTVQSLIHCSRTSMLRANFATSPNISPEKYKKAIQYCGELVRKHDYENYLCSLFAPTQARSAFWAIRAFNVELAQIRDAVSDVRIGKMKMMFWRDTIEQTFAGKPPQQPVALALAHSLQSCDLSSMWFKRVISEREKNLDDPQFMTMTDMETYSENTASALLYLQLEALGIKDVHADHAATHIGKANGITTFLRGIPFHASQRRMMLPAEITAKYGISEEEVFRNGQVEHLGDAIFEVATAAHDHLLTARSFLPNLPPSAYPALMNAIPCDVFLKKLEKTDFQIFNPKLAIREWKLPFIIWKRNRNMEF